MSKKKYLLLVLTFILFSNLIAQQIVIPKNDTREYKSILLKNGIQAILISDKNTQQAAAAIDIGIGSFENPNNMEGLAHFLEHMLFLGNKKYPKTNEFSDFLSQHGGYTNAYTSSKNTNYHFSVHYDYLAESLDRLAEFFISPLFNEDYLQKEIQAVHSEYQKNLLFEDKRAFAVLKTISNPDHPFAKFHTGNLQTLSAISNIREQVLLFYKKYYIPDLMKVAVIGRESLADLEKLVKVKFGKIPQSQSKIKLPLKRYNKRVYNKENTPAFVQIQSLKNIRKLNLIFEIDSTKKFFDKKATYYVASLAGNESKGTILSFLKEKGWAVSLTAGVSIEHIKTDFFSLDIELTLEGEKNIKQIIKVVFDYLALIKEAGVVKWRFEEMKEIANLNFHHKDIFSPLSLVSYLSAQAQYYKPKNLLNASWKFGKFDKQAIYQVLDQLVVDNLKVIYTTPHNIPLPKKDKWYSTSYRIYPITPSDKFYWKTSKNKNKNLFLPIKNTYLLSKIPRISQGGLKGVLQKLPFKKVAAYHVKDTSFQVPKIKLYLDILTPDAYSNPKNSSFTRIYASLLRDTFAQELYLASLLDYSVKIHSGVTGLSLELTGYPEKMEFFTLQVLKILTKTKFTNEHFNLFRQKIKEYWENLNLSPAYRLATYEFQQFTKKPFWYYEDYLSVLDTLSYQEFVDFQSNFFRSLAIEFFVYGNIQKKEATYFIKKILANIEFIPLSTKPTESIIQLPRGANYFFQRQSQDINSAIITSYQAQEKTASVEVKMNLLENIIKSKFYDFIRTKRQLGYLVWSYYTGIRQSNSFLFVVQSAVANPSSLQGQINEFLNSFEQELTDLNKQEFTNIVTGLHQIYEQKPENFADSSNFYYSAIQQKDYLLKRKKILQKELQTIKKHDLLEFYRALFLDQNTRFFAIHILGKDTSNTNNLIDSKEIIDRSIFKSSQKYISIP